MEYMRVRMYHGNNCQWPPSWWPRGCGGPTDYGGPERLVKYAERSAGWRHPVCVRQLLKLKLVAASSEAIWQSELCEAFF